MRAALEGFNDGGKYGGTKIINLRYADDTTLTCNSRHELLDLLRRIKDASEKKGLLLNTKKTKILVVDRYRTKEDFIIDGQQIEEVSHFEYLGSMINNIGDSTVEIKRRLAIARSKPEYAKYLEESWDFHQPESTPSKCCCFLDCHLWM